MTALGVDLFDEAGRARVEQLRWSLAQRLLELWRRDQAREPAQRAFTEKTLEQWWTAIERPGREELALFDPPIN
jgi:hypothetical protein